MGTPVPQTAQSIIAGALKFCNVYASGESLAADDAADALETLNDLLESLSTDEASIYATDENVFTFVGGQYQYTIGNYDAGTFAGTVTLGSPTITGVIVPANMLARGDLTGTGIPAGTTILSFNAGLSTVTMSANATVTPGAPLQIAYTIPGDFKMQRPLRITQAFTRVTSSSSGLDYPIEIIDKARYSRIGYKGIPAPWPIALWYNRAWPLGQLFFYQSPSGGGQLHLYTDTILTNVASLTTQIVLPQGYNRFLKRKLARELAPEFGATWTQHMEDLAKEAEDFVKSLNSVPQEVARYDGELCQGARTDAGWDPQWRIPVSFDGGDFGFVGQSYTASDPAQDRQATVNWYTEVSQDDKSKTPVALLGCPGLNPLLHVSNGPAGGEVRGCWVLPGGTSAIVVTGNYVTRVTMTVPATQTSIAQFSVTGIGTLSTNNGPVVMRDNGIGGYVMIADGSFGYLLNLATNFITVIADAGFVGPDRIAFIDGWWIFNVPGTNKFATNSPTPYTTTFSAAFFALKDSTSDNLITLMENNRELWLIGERASEVWYNAGGANFSFSRVPGVAPQIGCAAKHSIARMGDSLVWLARSERGENVVVKTSQYGFEPISTFAIASAISSYPLVSDAIGFVYEEEEHLFYQLTFPTADKTLVYDASTGHWHERASFTSATGAFHRARANCFMNLQNLRLVGDFISGYIHQMSRNTFTDAGFDAASGLATVEPLVCVRRTPTLWSRENRKRLFHSSIQVDFRPGVGLQTGQGEDPQLMMRWSDDAGETYGNEHWVTIGKAGRTKNRAIIRKLGQARDRVYEARFSDPVRRDVVGATLFAQGEQAAG